MCVRQACAVPVAFDAGPGADGGVPCFCQSGCCLADGSCAAGNLPSACGINGAACVACAAPQGRCEAGQCVGVCTGCIDAQGTCAPGRDRSACGLAGGTCVECFVDQACDGGRCVGGTCSQASCPQGCCDRDGRCRASAFATCGVAGAACTECTSTQTCVAGVCRSP